MSFYYFVTKSTADELKCWVASPTWGLKLLIIKKKKNILNQLSSKQWNIKAAMQHSQIINVNISSHAHVGLLMRREWTLTLNQPFHSVDLVTSYKVLSKCFCILEDQVIPFRKCCSLSEAVDRKSCYCWHGNCHRNTKALTLYMSDSCFTISACFCAFLFFFFQIS